MLFWEAVAVTPPVAFSGNNLDALTAYAESRNNPNAVSPKGAMGTMQVMPATARDPGFGIRAWDGKSQDDLTRVGKDYRRAMQNKYGGDLQQMWGAYNAGPGRIDALIAKYGGDWLSHAPDETQGYVAGLMRRVKGQ